MRQDVAQQTVAAAPPAAVSLFAHLQGWNSAQWVALATIGYIALQAAYLTWKWYHEYKAKKRRR